MHLIDRHILREWLSILGLVLAAMVGLLIMHTLYDELEDLLRLGASAGEVARYCAIRAPGFLATLLPVCLLVSLLYALGRMHHSSEITAMRAAGLGLGRITRSVWVAGLFFCALVWWLNTSLVPWSVEQGRETLERLQVRSELSGRSADQVGARSAVTFDNAEDGRIWFINRYSEFTKRAYGVTISQLDENGVERSRVLAREGWRDAGGAGWMLRDGRELTFDPASGEVLATAAFRERRMADYAEDPELMQVYDAKPDTLSVFELRRVIRLHRAAESPKARAYELRYASLVAEPLMPLVIIAFAVPFAVAGVRVNPAVGVTKALGLFVVYFIAIRLGLLLGGRGTVAPMAAALLPHAALLGAGAWAWVKAR